MAFISARNGRTMLPAIASPINTEIESDKTATTAILTYTLASVRSKRS